VEVLRTAILDMLRRNKAGSITSADVVMQMYPEDWEQFLEESNFAATQLSRDGLVIIQEIELGSTKCLKITSPNKLY
jgi:hypothetical protein